MENYTDMEPIVDRKDMESILADIGAREDEITRVEGESDIAKTKKRERCTESDVEEKVSNDSDVGKTGGGAEEVSAVSLENEGSASNNSGTENQVELQNDSFSPVDADKSAPAHVLVDLDQGFVWQESLVSRRRVECITIGKVSSSTRTRSKVQKGADQAPVPKFNLDREFKPEDRVAVLYLQDDDRVRTWYTATIVQAEIPMTHYLVEYDQTRTKELVSRTLVYPPVVPFEKPKE